MPNEQELRVLVVKKFGMEWHPASTVELVKNSGEKLVDGFTVTVQNALLRIFGPLWQAGICWARRPRILGTRDVAATLSEPHPLRTFRSQHCLIEA